MSDYSGDFNTPSFPNKDKVLRRPVELAAKLGHSGVVY
jgi:hypothetical protein